MINRQNWLDVRAYLHYLEHGRDLTTVKRARSHLRHLLEWADETPLARARYIDPAYATYLQTARSDNKPGALARASIIRGLSSARLFFTWARGEWPQRYKGVSESWIKMLQPARELRLQNDLRIHTFYPIDDLLKIAAVSVETLRLQRAKVGACMLYLSGMRADALASLPISCVDLPSRQILQLPQFGVRTKNRKSAITYMLNIPELFAVVNEWDQLVRKFSPNALWYATLTRDGMSLTETKTAYVGRVGTLERDLELICERAGVTYYSPHKLRHGHVVYALKNARTMAEFKAISQNVMHASVTITDQVYGAFTGEEVKNIIGGLGVAKTADITTQIAELLALLRAQES